MNTSQSMSLPPSRVGFLLLAAAALWAATVAWLAARGALLSLVGAQYAVLVAVGIAAPTLLYAWVRSVRRTVAAAGLYWLTLLHIWRVPAALLFFWFGFRGELPPAFWIPAGVGDLLVGLYAARPLLHGGDPAYYRRFHVFGFADFVVAVGAGFAHSLIGDPRMAAVAMLPLALIPLFGVGLSGASHLAAFHLLRRASRRRADRTAMALSARTDCRS